MITMNQKLNIPDKPSKCYDIYEQCIHIPSSTHYSCLKLYLHCKKEAILANQNT